MAMLNDELAVARLVNCYDALPIRLIGTRCHLSENSYTGYSKVLADYAKHSEGSKKDDRLLEEKWIPYPTNARGGAVKVLIVGSRGLSLMKSCRFESEIKRSDFGHDISISKHNWHALYVNSIIVHANVWADKTPDAEVAAQMTDFDFKRHKRFPYKVAEGDGTKNSIAMDSLLAFKFAERPDEDKQFLIELETGSQAPAALREKIKRLVLFIHNGGFQEVFETDIFSGYRFFAMGIHDRLTPDNHRKMILREIAKTLREMEMEHYAPLFRVAAYPVEFTKIFKTKPGEEPTDPSIYFTRPVWYFPGYYDGHKLFDDLG